MVDLHCHILPALDDGALDLSDSVAMAREAERDGIATVCATPHIRDDHPVEIGELPARRAQLADELERAGVAVAIAAGGEVAQPSLGRLSDEQLRAVALGRGNWVLLEPAAGPLTAQLVRDARQLRARGFRALVAHPERHLAEDFLELLRELQEEGCLIQWTAAFIAEVDPCKPRDPLVRLLREGLVDVLGSDAHSSHGGRPVRLREGFRRLEEICGAERARWSELLAPRAVLDGLQPPPAPAADELA